MFDFSFRHFITISFAKVIFVVAIVIACLEYLFLLFYGFRMGGRGILMGVVMLLFGWIPPAILLIIVRLGLEFSVANIRTAQNTSQMVGRTDG
ncbi:DUF4282 domain-containing protein [Ruania zhangjianzhongii]|uniref:DUF4282 domain-containing protein n=1 Tax=Ruania zhangjianzhongii TaxID=2603206 RepID=UPI0011C729A2|nr:DUF4282 domain-containing protein [Ruania zhangjianzhongii]